MSEATGSLAAPAAAGGTRPALARVPAVVWVALVTAALLLPGLGSFGLWDPWELRLVEPAAGAGGAAVGASPAAQALQAAGLRLFGGGEAGARVMFALAALAAALAVFWAGRGLFTRRAALLATAALLSIPLFTLQARQAISDMPLVLALALALGGLGRFAWGRERRAAPVDLALGVAGLALGLFAGGALVGVLLPCLALLATRLVAPPPAPAPGAARVFFAVVAALAALVLGVLVLRPHTAGVYSWLLGGVPRTGAPTQTFEALVRQTGFGLFPWTAVAFFALGHPLVRDPAPGGEDRAAPGLFLLFFAGFGLALCTVRLYLVGDIRFPVLAPIALAVGLFLDDALAAEKPQPVAGFLVALGTMVIARDLYQAPEELPSLHTLEKLKWPPQMSGAGMFLGAGVAISLALMAALGLRAPSRRRVAGWAAAAVGLVSAGFVAQVLVPGLSRHLSLKQVLATHRQVARPGEPLAHYRVESRDPQLAGLQRLGSADNLASFLRGQPSRGFALIAATELAAVDATLKHAQVPYLLLDASSSRVYLLASHPRPGEEDRSPLRANVWMAPQPPALPGGPTAPAVWPPERPPWPAPRVKVSAVFGNAIELIGADFPTEIRRSRALPLALHFRVHNRPPAGFNIFVHMELPGQPIHNGDHEPVGGIFPTAHWLPGEYIVDRYKIELPRALISAGTYRISMGMWPGGNLERLPITAGQNDGVDRVPLGVVEVR